MLAGKVKGNAGPGVYVVQCDTCRGEYDVEGESLEIVRKKLSREGWMEAAQRGKERDRWLWWCPVCAPKRSDSFGLSTSAFTKKGGA